VGGSNGDRPRLWAVGEARRRRWLPLFIVLAILLAGAGAALVWRLDLLRRHPAATTLHGTTGPTRPTPLVGRRPSRLPAAEIAVRRFASIGLPLYCGGGRGRYVALTFDDGPGPDSWRALRILRAAHAHVTFFIVGRQVAAWPEAVRGEAEIAALGDHTWSHADLTRLGRPGIVRQIGWTRNAIRRASGEDALLFRPPYGAHDRRVDRIVRADGLLEVLWSVDSQDSLGAGWRRIARDVLRNVRPGSIVVLHENHLKTLRALQRLILPALRRRHYRLVSIPELLVLDPPTPAQLRHHDC
jgi:peptidoglycan/xylan/chitin deacetylase (PgdA/CDA1 family)